MLPLPTCAAYPATCGVARSLGVTAYSFLRHLVQASTPAVVQLPEVDDRFELPSMAKKQESAPIDAESEKQRVRNGHVSCCLRQQQPLAS